jgi:sterol desaturase/sphingolipid hydroxylase (fatty acid hydroxylase superfamily)
MSWPIAACVIAVYLLLLPTEWAFVLFGGTCAGYLFYDWTHYFTHHFRSPKTRLGKLLRRAHAVHHYRLFEHNMGISSPLWDWVFGTYAWSEETMRAALRESREVERQADVAERAERGPARGDEPISSC